MLIDIHIHTKEHSRDARMAARNIVHMARESGLDGVVFTDHGYRWPDDELAELRSTLDYPFLILSGAEVMFDSLHMLVFNGIEGCLPSFSDPAALSRCAESRGGLTVVAHAFSPYYRVTSHDLLRSGARGIEVWNARRQFFEMRDVMTARDLDMAELAGSDEHGTVPHTIGKAATFFPELVTDSRDIVRQIKEHKTRIHRP